MSKKVEKSINSLLAPPHSVKVKKWNRLTWPAVAEVEIDRTEIFISSFAAAIAKVTRWWEKISLYALTNNGTKDFSLKKNSPLLKEENTRRANEHPRLEFLHFHYITTTTWNLNRKKMGKFFAGGVSADVLISPQSGRSPLIIIVSAATKRKN